MAHTQRPLQPIGRRRFIQAGRSRAPAGVPAAGFPPVPPATPNHPAVMSDGAACVVAWNAKAVKAGHGPKGWAEFWDVRALPGRRGLWKRPFQTMEVALMADGADKDKLYPLDVERALRSLGKIRQQIY